ncbi:MAG: flavodoxin family protein [Bacteroidales bacterium]|jgi:flavodoxin
MKCLIIVYSYHHGNTEKIARAMAEVLSAPIKKPNEVDIKELKEYELIGFGSGIYSEKHHEEILNLVDKLPIENSKKAFIYSTSSNIGPFEKYHLILKDKLKARGYVIVGEFSCVGYNTNSFLKILGGLNRDRPNVEDLKRAKTFALSLIK